jgi:CBS domain-containing protein
MDRAIRLPEEILAYRTLAQILAAKQKALWTAKPGDSAFTAMQSMAQKNIGFPVVLDRDAIVGALSERDVARRLVLENKPAATTLVADIMVREVITVDLAHSFADCLRLMHQHSIRHLPVTDRSKVVAIVSIRDLMSEAVAHHAKIISELERERLTIFTSTA